MIEFFETKAFGAATVDVLTTMVSLYSGTNAGAAIGLGLFVAIAFLLIFKKTVLSRSPSDVTWTGRAKPLSAPFDVAGDQRAQCDDAAHFVVCEWQAVWPTALGPPEKLNQP